MPPRPKLSDAETCRLVLVVDDNHEIREMVVRVLNHFGISSVVTAESAARALQILQTREVAVVLTDVRMPEIDGLELLRVVKRDYARTRRLILTGRETDEIVKQGIDLAHRALLLKPLNDLYNFYMAVDHELAIYRVAALEAARQESNGNGQNGHA
jgi:CheY-like chemotaxis protein